MAGGGRGRVDKASRLQAEERLEPGGREAAKITLVFGDSAMKRADNRCRLPADGPALAQPLPNRRSPHSSYVRSSSLT